MAVIVVVGVVVCAALVVLLLPLQLHPSDADSIVLLVSPQFASHAFLHSLAHG